MYYFLYILFLNTFGISDTENDNVVTIEKKVKIHHFHHTKVVAYRIDSCIFYFDAHHFMSESGLNEGKHKYHEPLLKDLTLLLGQRDTVDITKHTNTGVVSSLVNEGLKKGYVQILFSGKVFHAKTILNVEYWDKGVLNSDFKSSNMYRPDSDVYTTEDGEIFYYFRPSIKRVTEHGFRD